MGESKRTYQLQAKSLIFNQAVSEKEFAIDVPEGGKVYRRFIGKTTSLVPNQPMPIQELTYYAIKPGVISLTSGSYDIDKMPWLEKELPESEYIPSSGGVSDWVRWTLMSIGGILILYALGRMLYERIWKKP